MRPIQLAVGLLAGAAVNLILIPIRRRRRRRRQALPPPRLIPTRPHHGAILTQLDIEAPLTTARKYAECGRDNSFDCTFCLDSIVAFPEALLRITKCDHVFHAHCLESWAIYTADICLDWTQYTVSEDGRIASQVRMPTCPNCTAELHVIPDNLLRSTVLTAVARSLSLRDLSVAAEMYNAGVVYREGSERRQSAAASHRPERRAVAANAGGERGQRRYTASRGVSASASRPVERTERGESSTGGLERTQRRYMPTWAEAVSAASARSLEYMWRPRTEGERREGAPSEAVAFVTGGGRRVERVGLGMANRVALQAPS